MQIKELSLPGLKLIQPRVFQDERGYFFESYRQPLYQELGLDCTFVQDNHSFSHKNTIRGMHFQRAPGQAKLIFVSQGSIWDVAVDIRPHSPTFGQWESVILDDQEFQQLFIPVGFAHGYCILSKTAQVHYKVSNVYDPEEEKGFRFDDPDVAIDWPTKQPIISERDRTSPFFRELWEIPCKSG